MLPPARRGAAQAMTGAIFWRSGCASVFVAGQSSNAPVNKSGAIIPAAHAHLSCVGGSRAAPEPEGRKLTASKRSAAAETLTRDEQRQV